MPRGVSMGKRQRRKFTDEFKAKAVELVRTSGKSIMAVAGDLDLTASSLGTWVKQAEVDAGRGRGGALTSEEREELSRLRKENRVLKEEREILKKAAAHSTGQRTQAGLRRRGWSHHEAARSPGHVVQGEGGAMAPLESWRIAK